MEKIHFYQSKEAQAKLESVEDLNVEELMAVEGGIDEDADDTCILAVGTKVCVYGNA